MASRTQCTGAVEITGTAPNLDWKDAGAALTCSFDPEDKTEDYPTGSFILFNRNC